MRDEVSSRDVSLPEDEGACCDRDVVHARELDEIVHRRRAAFGREESPDQVRKSLVGLALSGGGVRSAAISLGVLQSLFKRRILPFVDFLSTVSGGGYAGAYLSSVALKSSRQSHAQGSAARDGVRAACSARDDGEDEDELFPIARGATGKAKRRMLQFIHGGNYLRKTWVFFNRYLIGLFLIWAVMISGLVAVTSLTAWVFRCLDYTRSRAWLDALGFGGDIKLAFFPSFVLLGLWLVFWTVSYLKFERRSTGMIARWVFYLLIITTAVAVAALIGNGEIPLGGTGRTNDLGAYLYTFVVSAILVGLLPYFTPTRLLRSGTAPKNVTERYVFWVATRALAFGVPFVLVAFFARENISGWNDRRDDRLTNREVNYDLAAPLWHQVANLMANQDTNGKSAGGETVKSLWYQVANLMANQDTNGKSAGGQTVNFPNIWEPDAKINADELAGDAATAENAEKVTAPSAKADKNNEDKDAEPKDNEDIGQAGKDESLLRRLASLFENLQKSRLASNAALMDSDDVKTGAKTVQASMAAVENVSGASDSAEKFPSDTAAIERHTVESAPVDDAEYYLAERWWQFAKYLGELIAGNEGDERNNDVYQFAKETVRRYEIQWQIVELLNESLQDPGFYETLLPPGYPKGDNELNDVFAALQPYHPDLKPDEEKVWLARLNALRAEAERKAREWKRRETADQKLNGEDANGVAKRNIAESLRKDEIVSTNRALLKACYGNLIKDRNIVYSSVVLTEDQRTRWRWFVVSLIIFIVAGLVVDLNATSWHGFYSSQIGMAWIEPVPGLGRQIPLARLETTDVGRPYHLIMASMHLMGRRGDGTILGPGDFLFSKLYCGSNELGYRPTAEYMLGDYSLDDAIAVSGAAVSPAQTNNPLVLALLTLLNVRLGQWIVNPACKLCFTKWGQFLRERWPVTPFRVLPHLLMRAERRPTCFVTDGGHHENLGVEALLNRRCRLILAIDAGEDGGYSFSDLTKLVRWARLRHGIRFAPLGKEDQPIQLEPLIPREGSESTEPESENEATGQEASSRVIAAQSTSADDQKPAGKWSRTHHLILKIIYPAGAADDVADGYLIYMKSTMTGDEPIELRQFAKAEDVFPHNPTADQFYDPARFEAYTQLGYHIAESVGCYPGQPVQVADSSIEQLIQQLTGVDVVATGSSARGEATAAATAAPAKAPTASEASRLIRELRSRDAAERDRARENFGRLHTELLVATSALLKAWREHPDDVWLQKAISELFLENAHAAFPYLRDVIGQEHDPKIRKAAVWFLGEFANEECGVDQGELCETFVTALGDKDPEVRLAAVGKVQGVLHDDPGIQQALERARRDTSSRVRAAAGRRS